MLYESERVEYKESFVTDIYKEIIAFANTGGGTVYIGINDAGEKVGISDPDDVYLRLTNGLERTDYWDYPQEAIREALLNAVIHREYGFSGSTIINIICNGISLPRNRFPNWKSLHR